MNTPLLLIIWRRPHTLRRLIDAIRPVAPTCLFVACDGPNPARPDEAQKVAATRSVIESEIDWPCQIERFYSSINRGCRISVSDAITWFFEHVEEGIILEDDCIPHQEFFSFCTTLLNRYRSDTRIWSICGSNFQANKKRSEASYYFSIHGDSWGWATWRRAWSNYARAKSDWLYLDASSRLDDVFEDSDEREYWRSVLDQLFIQGTPDAWDYQWFLASWLNNALHAWPNSCLVSNCGFDQDGTHTFGNSPFSSLPLESIGDLVHPQFVLPSSEADRFAFLHRRSGYEFIARRKYGIFFPLLLRYYRLKDFAMKRSWRNIFSRVSVRDLRP